MTKEPRRSAGPRRSAEPHQLAESRQPAEPRQPARRFGARPASPDMRGVAARRLAARAAASALAVVFLAVLLAAPALFGVGSEQLGAEAPAGRGGPAAARDASGMGADGAGLADSSDGSDGAVAGSAMAGGSLPVYEEGSVLAKLASGATLEQIEEALASEESLAGVSVESLSGSFAKLSLPGSLPVENAAGLLSRLPVFQGAQPNYFYYPADIAGAVSAASAAGAAGASGASSAAGAAGASGAAGAADSANAVGAAGDTSAAGAAAASTAIPAAASLSAPAASATEASATAQLVGQSLASTASLVAGTALGDALGIADTARTPDDALVGQQWELASVNAEEAWELAAPAYERNAAAGMKPVTIAVIDAGFQADHEDLEDNLAFAVNTAFPGEALSSSLDIQKHGTHVAGIAGARTNNAKGVASVTDNLCRIGLLQAAKTPSLFTDEGLLGAFDYVMDNAEAHNIRVINMSIGAPLDAPADSSADSFLYEAIDEARSQGIVTVVAACNNGSGGYRVPFYAFPSDYDNVVSVMNLRADAASGDGVSLNPSSNYNKDGQKDKNISAPGTNIMSCSPYATEFGNYRFDTGTSMASPLVAGVMGLVFTVYPQMDPETAVSKLYAGAKDIVSTGEGWDAKTGHGEVDARAALDATQPYLAGATTLMSGESALWKMACGDGDLPDAVWASSDEGVVTVDASGALTAVARLAAGETATATISATSPSAGATRSAEVTIVSNDIADARFSVSPVEDAIYDGSPHEPQPVVKRGSKVLAPGVDYTVSYSGNLNAGAATVTVRGIGSYEGSVTCDFSIVKAPIGSASITLSSTSLAYSGVPQAPSVSVFDVGHNAGTQLASGRDYAASVNAVLSGDGSVTVMALPACRNFTGSQTLSFTVVAPTGSGASSGSEPPTAASAGSRAASASAPDPAAAPDSESVSTSTSGSASGSISPSGLDPASAPTSPSAATPASLPVYRLFNKNTGEHLFTTSKSEMRSLRKAGWKYERVAWTSPEKSSAPVYRLLNKNTGEHLFTKSARERRKLRKSGWKYEGIAWYSGKSKAHPVYRLYNSRSGAHHFTASARERDKLKKLGWKREGVAFYAV